MPCYKNSYLTKDAMANIKRVCKNLNYELIVVIDWCPEDTRQVVEDNKRKDVKVIDFLDNKWVTKARNEGVKQAKGEYICVINNDVVFPEWFFEKLMWGFEDWIMMTEPRYTQKQEYYWNKVYYFNNHICWFCYMFKQEWKKFLFPIDERMRIFWNDNWLWYKMIYWGYHCKLVRDAICHHYKSVTSINVENKDVPIFKKIAKEEWRNVVPVYEIDQDPEKDIIFPN